MPIMVNNVHMTFAMYALLLIKMNSLISRLEDNIMAINRILTISTMITDTTL